MTLHSPPPAGAIRTRVLLLLIALIVCAAIGTVILSRFLDRSGKTASAPLPPGVESVAVTKTTVHYAIASNATPEQTARVAQAVESLYAAYAECFRERIAPQANAPKLKLMLYRDRAEFEANNASQPWAEAYYRAPWSYAYYDAGEKNPYHWMLHEATHQLRNEVAHFPKTKWIDEGVASYFSTSRLRDGKLALGEIDPDTYPIWQLRGLNLTGDLQEDIRKGRIVPLRDLMADTGPPIAEHVNLYYVEYWSLSHFLFHYRDGRYAQRYRALIAQPGTPEAFERLIGPIERIQDEWYAYLKTQLPPARYPMKGPP
ncbi:DUF1570 domain-containing protein [Luteimonas gilva]|uniref:DUF1570 domain-containing protein n=1 Tax=Luteimonas gilva TaxID=2572684 RepID=A0A4U5JK61_9GAMM|nr:DUF1570 domain-containing protein [Luteimonas gilva]TKR29435.1 DUF1570 domain-containing protein [Luteimonas gilva]